VLHLIRQLVAVEPIPRETSLEAALDYLNRVQKRRAVVFLLSDFLAPAAKKSLAVSSRRHDLIGVTISDPREQVLPDVGFITMIDPETSQQVEVDTRHPAVRRLFAERSAKRREETSNMLKKCGVDELPIRTDEKFAGSLRRFFHMRERRFR
jgi:uncharacterized protein (DUF58 family)